MKKHKTQNKPNIAGTLDKKYRRRRIWLRVVSVLSSFAVFCTVYALILPAITWEASSDDVFTVNGKRIDQNYSWTDESGELSLDVHLKGDVTFDSKLPIGTKLEFDVELNPEEESELLPEYASEVDAQTLLVMKMHLSANGKELDLSACTADVTLRIDKDAIYAAKVMLLSVDDGDGDVADDTDIVLTVTNENGQLAATTLTEDDDPVLHFTIQANESVAAEITANPSFTIQHYFWFPQVVADEGTGTKLPFIDTTNSAIKKDGPTGLYIPNNSSLPTTNVVLDSANGNKLMTRDVLVPLFEDEETDYLNNPQITYMNRLFNNRTDYNGNYTLVEVWVKPSETLENYDQYAQYADADGFVKYEVPENAAGTRHMPERIRFTNNPSNTYITKDPSKPRTYTTSYPYNFTILIQNDTVVRLVFEVTEQMDFEEPVNFFDYDISSGILQNGRYNSKEQGINNPLNFKDSGIKYAFGNRPAETGLENLTFYRDRINYINRYNNYNSYTVYQGCAFGLVQGLRYSSEDRSLPIFANGIVAPDLFSKNDKNTAGDKKVTGKTAYVNGEYSLGFYRQGGTYTLSYVKDTTDRIAADESVTVDGNLDDSGWKSDGWITVNRNSGTFQGGITAANRDFSYKFQLHTDGKKLYVAAVYDNATWVNCPEGGAGTKLRIWLKTNPNATVYTHFYDLYSAGGEIKVLGKKNGSTTQNLNATEIENSSVTGAMKIEDNRVIFELSVDIAEFGGESGFEYFINGGHYIGENIQLLYPAVNSLPYNTWDSAHAASAEKNATSDLRYFENPNNGTTTYYHIFTNGFWPMDSSPSAGAPGNDPLFGAAGSTVGFSGGPIPSDDGKDHNSYFGMSYTVDFTIEPGYCAPLEYWFYGDDDMWVFLDKVDDPNSTPKLVADIGGVHSSVGEFVNLWDYIDHIPLRDENGNENTASETYRLTIFYTERGASGSTCYMRFTVPLDTNITPAPEREEALMFEKVLNEGTDAQGNVTSDEEFEFLLTLTNEDGTPYYDLYSYAIYNRADTPDHRAEDAVAVEEGVIGILIPESGKYTFTLKGGQYILITNLPDNTYYTIEEVSIGNYATLYQKGRHEHDENGNQIDTLEGAVRYNYSVGNPERINAMDHNYVCFTNSHAVKAETDPGDGKHVHIDDLITYEIEWGNDRNEIADIVITDPLDSGLDFVSAGFKSLTSAGGAVTEYGDSGRWEWNGSDDTYFMDDECSITYDEATRTVVWAWLERPAESSGIVFLTVRVNEAASEEETTPGKFGTMTSRVENQAMVQIGNDHVIETNIVENPVWDPVKTEITPGAGKPVLTDSEIVYTVTWKNYHDQSATVTVRDPLDSALEYISGSAEVYYGAYGTDEQIRIDNASISYDPQTHTVGWDLGEQAAGSEGYVIFKVRVKKESVQKRAIRNTGFVKVGNDAEIKTNRIDNPVYGYMLPSTGGSGTFIFTICGLTLMLGPLIVRFMARRKRERKSLGGTSRSQQ